MPASCMLHSCMLQSRSSLLAYLHLVERSICKTTSGRLLALFVAKVASSSCRSVAAHAVTGTTEEHKLQAACDVTQPVNGMSGRKIVIAASDSDESERALTWTLQHLYRK
jgi:hypothetical protein